MKLQSKCIHLNTKVLLWNFLLLANENKNAEIWYRNLLVFLPSVVPLSNEESKEHYTFFKLYIQSIIICSKSCELLYTLQQNSTQTIISSLFSEIQGITENSNEGRCVFLLSDSIRNRFKITFNEVLRSCVLSINLTHATYNTILSKWLSGYTK